MLAAAFQEKVFGVCYLKGRLDYHRAGGYASGSGKGGLTAMQDATSFVRSTNRKRWLRSFTIG
jgi:hypothetical protein